MSSKGSDQIAVRVPADVKDAVRFVVAERNRRKPADRPWTMSDWVLDAILEKLAKIARGRGLDGKYEWDRPDDNQPAELTNATHRMLEDLIFGKEDKEGK